MSVFGNPLIKEVSGVSDTVPLDSPAPGFVFFNYQFSQVFGVWIMTVEDSTNDTTADVDVCLTSLSPAGFTFTAAGGPPNSLGRVFWRAIGA